ncbi:Lsr2 family protein [Rhodococcus sp. BP-252]|uniref:Lsr2 protein n=1 Tax=Rhodococcoides kyotonense TaxID=398843 RepID=A0A177YEW1_9NOCA|nr:MULTISPECIES: Lsr2 family protein [Rhodococcus]MBY6414900.1 Lsr2 family protein [Rhodococcus sp. BP-320]MBY6419861.1 Lsr2 family protein [Rhodococcus sp. BP-321]MBY6424832.1 Lsr2 family protein [Rhodococcus sp. BP-324]MBY6429796.1 Lsr2 family protein [Rhodococcus sp. BP-323]MBY6434757.1 Lsr2 family protein [Rhodococcus sp. BP-322]
MAKQVSVQLVDDIDNSVIEDGSGESIEFSVAGVDYVIDLKNKNATEFHRKLDYYIEHATRVGGRKRKASPAGTATAAPTAAPSTTSSSKTKRDPAQTRAIRQWAFDEGYELSSRGRIPAEIEEAYDAAH